MTTIPEAADAATWGQNPHFGIGGTRGPLLREDTAEEARAVALQADGKEVAAGTADGDFVLVRFDPTAQKLDLGFADRGQAIVDMGGIDSARAVAVTSSQAILAAGVSGGDAALLRLTSAGVPDAAFGTGGRAVINLGGADEVNAMSLLSDGSIVLAGTVGSNPVLARLTPSGALDTAFGVNGIATIALGSPATAAALFAEAGGRLVVAGTRGADVFVAAFTSTGAVDTEFGVNGSRTVDLGGADAAHALTELTTGRIVVAGSNGPQAALAAFTSTGAVDTGFGTAGVARDSGRGAPTAAYAIANQSDALVIGGTTPDGFYTARFTSDGVKDGGFSDGNAGWNTVYGAGSPSIVRALAVGSDGRLVMGGTGWGQYGSMDFMMGRLYPAGGMNGRGLWSLKTADSFGRLLVQPDGKTVLIGTASLDGSAFAGGDIFVMRFTTKGELDPAFGPKRNGKVSIDFGGQEWGEDIALGPNNTLVVGARGCGGAAVARLLSDGTLDPAFGGGDGKLTFANTTGDSCGMGLGAGLAVQSNGGVFLALGRIGNIANAVAHVLADGTPDPAFGAGGVVANGVERPKDMALAPNGKIVLVGEDGTPRRLTTTGALDGSFAAVGISGVRGMSVAVQPDGKVLVGGGERAWGQKFVLSRYTATGAFDASFGTGGTVYTNFGDIGQSSTYGCDVYAIHVLGDGRILASGLDVLDRAFALYHPNGSLDTSFDKDGRLSVYDGRNPSVGHGAIRPDGVIVYGGGGNGGGWSRTSIGSLVALPDPPLPTGYWMVTASGAVYPFGSAGNYGNATAKLGGVPAVDIESTPKGDGYWILDQSGRVFPFGNATGRGNAALEPGERAMSISALNGAAYWVFTDRGRVLPFGGAPHFGDMAGTPLNGPVLDSVGMPAGNGYYMVASDGGIFAFGSAKFQGSMGGRPLNAPVQSLVPDGDGVGYWLVASDGGVFAFEAGFRGSMGGARLNKSMTGMVRYGNGYLMVAEDGGIFNFSDKPFAGSLGHSPPTSPVVSVAAFG